MMAGDGGPNGRVDRATARVRDALQRGEARAAAALARADLAVAARPWLEPTVLGTAIVLGILYLIAIAEGRVFFHHDECDYLNVYLQRPPIEWLRPHNEHWTTLSIAAWSVLVNLFGTGSYVPFKVLLLVGHGAAVVALWALIRPYQPRLALLAAILFLFIGAGHENLLYAIQIQVTAVMALGLWALWAALRDRMVLATVLLTVGLAFQTTELLFLPAVAVVLAARDRWRSILWLLVPAGVFLAWYLTWGREGVWHPLIDRETFGRVIPWLFVSLPTAFYDTFGIRLVDGLSTVLVVVGVLVVAALTRGWRPPPITLGALTGLFAGYTLVGLGRAPGFASSRYVYIASAMYLLALTGLPRIRGVWVAVALVVFVFALRYNYFELQAGLVAFEGYSRDPALACRL